MDFALTEEQAQLRDLIERFAADQRYDEMSQRSTYRDSASGYGAENWAALAELGLLALPFSSEDGGLDGGAVETITLMEALGRGLVTEPLLEELYIAAGLVAALGSAEQRQEWLPGVLAGESHLSLAHFERAARFDPVHIGTRAVRRGSDWQLDGEKDLALAAGAAGTFIVSAREEAQSRLGFFLVAADAAGLERRDFRLADGSCAAALKLRGVVPVARLEGGGDEFMRHLDGVRIAACAEMLGIMTRLLDATLDHVRNRKQFGMPLGSFQVIQHRLADLYVSVEQSRSQLLRAALSTEEGDGHARAVAGMKSYVSAAALRLGEECIHLHGAMGTTDELLVGHGHKRLLVLATLFGDTDFELARFIRLAA